MSSYTRTGLFFFLLCWAGLASAAVEGQLTLKPATTSLGEPVTLQATLRYDGNVRFHDPQFGEKWTDFEVSGKNWSEPREEEGQMVQVFTTRLQPFATGDVPVPALSIPWSDGEGNLHEWTGPKLVLEVKSVVEQLEEERGAAVDYRPVKPPIATPFPYARLLWVLAGAFLLGLLLYYFLKRIGRKEPDIPLQKAAPLLPPDEEALRALAQLESEEGPRRLPVKTFYTTLSDIFRRYAGRRYGCDALDMTSSELLQLLGSRGWNGELYEMLARDCMESDSVKFAKFVPGPPQRQEALERVRQMVKASAPAPDTSEPAEEGGSHV